MLLETVSPLPPGLPLKMPPPLTAELPERVLFCTLNTPLFKTPPPLMPAELPERVLFETVTVAALPA